MANNKGNIRFGVGFDVDKSGLETLKASLREVSSLASAQLKLEKTDEAKAALESVVSSAQELESIFVKSYNFKLNSVDFTKFSTLLKSSTVDLNKFTHSISQLGTAGPAAVRNLQNALIQTQKHIKQTSGLIDKMTETLANTVRWSVASSAVNAVTGSVQKAWDFTKKLDTSLNDIRIVTGKSADEMDRFAQKANRAAKNLGANTKAYSDAALIYYQQGLNDTDAQARADVTVKAANVTGQSAQAVSEQLTAVWNGYKVSAEESEKYIDKLAAVAASTAADLEELSTGMSRVAAAANIMGVDIDQLNAQLATIVSVTREAPESIGTALKTVYARMSDIEAGLDTETTLGEYTSQMAEMGINVLDAKGNLRDMGDVVEEIGGKWHTLNREQQVSLAQSIAGTRQYSRMMALFDNWGQYEAALATSQTSMGELQKQQDIYMESTEAHLAKMRAQSEDLYDSLFDQDTVNNLIGGLTNIIKLADNFVEAIGGGTNALILFGSMATKHLSKQAGDFIGNSITNKVNARKDRADAKAARDEFDKTKDVAYATSGTLLEKLPKDIADLEAKIKDLQTQRNAETNLEKQTELDAKIKASEAQIANIQEEEHKLQDSTYAALYDKEIAMQKEWQKHSLFYMENKSKMSEEEQQKWQEDLDKEKKTLDELAAFRKKDYEERLRLQDTAQKANAKADAAKADAEGVAEIAMQEDALAALLELNEETIQAEKDKYATLLKIRQEYEEAIAAIDEDVAMDADVKNAERAVATAKAEENEAMAVFKSTTRTLEGVEWSDSTTLNAREGAMSGGAYITPDKMVARLSQRDTELAEQQVNIKSFKTSVDALNTDDTAEGRQAVVDLSAEWVESLTDESGALSAKAEQLGISIERMQEYMRLQKEMQAGADAGTEAGVLQEKTAGRKIAAMAQEDLSSNRKKVQKAAKTIQGSADKKAKAEKALEDKKAEKAAQKRAKAEEKAEKKILKAKEETAEASKQAGEEAEAAGKKQKKAAEEARSEEAKLNAELSSLDQSFNDEELSQKFKDFGSGLADTVGGLGQVLVGITAIKNVGSIWEDEDLSLGEKMLQTVIALGTGFGSIYTGAVSAAKGIKDVVTNIGPAIGQYLGLAAAKKADANATDQQTAATLKGTIAKWAENAAWYASPITWIVAIILAAVAATALLVAGIVQLTKALQTKKEEEDAKKAVENANMLREAYAAVKDEYEALKASIADYKDSQNAIDQMITGTDEWRKAIAEANDQVMELIKTYPELAKYMSNEGGRLIISEEGLNAVEEAKRVEVGQANRAALLAQVRSSEATLKLKNAQTYTDDTQSILKQNGYYISKEDTQQLADLLAESPDAFSSSDAFAKALENSEFASLSTTLWSHKEALEELTDATRKAETEQAALRQQIALSRLQENAVYQGLMDEHAQLTKEKAEIKREDYASVEAYYKAQADKQAEINEVQESLEVAQNLSSSEAAQAKIEKEKKTEVNEAWAGGSVEEREAMVKEYWSRKLGIPTEDIEVKNTGSNYYKVRWRGENGQFGKWERNEVSDLKSGLADFRAADYEIPKEELQKQLDAWNALDDMSQKAFKSFVGDGKGDFSSLTASQFQDVANVWKDIDWEDIEANENLKKDLEAKAKALGLETTDEALKSLLNGITEAIDNYNLEQRKINALTNIGSFAKGSFSALFDNQDGTNTWDSLSQSMQKFYAQAWNDLATQVGAYGEQAATQFIDLISGSESIIQGALTQVDWTNEKSINTFRELAIEITGSAEATEDYIRSMQKLNGTYEAFNLNDSIKQFNNIQEAIKGLSNVGDTISADVYETLGDEFEAYFVRMADGTYALTQSAEKFRVAAKAAYQEELIQSYKEAQEEADKARTTASSGLTSTQIGDIKNQYTKSERGQLVQEGRDQRFNFGNDFFTAGYGSNDAAAQRQGWQDEKAGNGSTGDVSINVDKWRKVVQAIAKYSNTYDDRITGWNDALDSAEGTDKKRIDATILTAIQKAWWAVQGELDTEAQNLEKSEKTAIKDATSAQQATASADAIKLDQQAADALDQTLASATSLSNLNAVAESTGLSSKIINSGLDFNSLTIDEINAIEDDEIRLYAKHYTRLREQSANFQAGVNIYQDIEKELEQLEQQMTVLQTSSQLLVEGSQAWLNNLKSQNILLNDQIKKQRILQQLAQTDKTNAMNDLVSNLSQYGEFSIDPTGKSRDELLAIVENMVRSKGLDLDIAQLMINDINTAFDKIDEAESKIAESAIVIQEKAIQKLENNLAAFEAEITLKIDKRELQRTFEDFKKSFLDEDDFLNIGKSLQANFELVSDNVATYQQALRDLDSYEIISQEEFDRLTEAGQISDNQLTAKMVEEKRREILNSLMEEGLSLQEAHAAMLDNIVAYHERITEAYEEYASLIEGVNSALEHQKTLLELMYGDKAASRLTDFYNQQIANQDKIMAMRKREYDSAVAQMAVWDTLSEEEQKAVQERYLAASENYFASITDMAQMYQDQYLNTIQAAFDEFTDSFKKDEYDWIVSSSEDFLNGIDAAFGLQSVERAFDKSINANTSISAQAKLNKLREEELAKLREKDKLTKYDLDRAQKRLAVAQAEIALQEAQANKSKMRLVRGADGTYSYQYEADMDAISKAEEDLAKANQDLVSLDQQELKSNYDKAWELVQEYYSKIQELDPVKDADEIAKLQEEYGARIEALGLNASTVYENLKASVAEAGEFLGQQFTIEADFAWADSDFAKAIMGFDAEGSAWTNLTATVSGAAGTLAENLQTLDTNLEEAIKAYKKVVDEQLVPATETTIGNLEDLAGPGGALDQLRSAATIAATALEQAAASITATVGVNQYLNTGIHENQNSPMAATHGGFTYRINDTAEWNAYIESLFGENGSLKLTDEQKAAFAEKYGYTDGDFDEFIRQITDDEYIWASNYDILTKLIAAKQAGTFDTGGYTGAWGAEGRAAILHEKELVLNQQDTRNILAAVNIARQLENALSASLLERIVDLMANNYTERLNELRQTTELKQNVHITAEFPNATDRNEIEAAFDELINLATQKVYEN